MRRSRKFERIGCALQINFEASHIVIQLKASIIGCSQGDFTFCHFQAAAISLRLLVGVSVVEPTAERQDLMIQFHHGSF